MGRGRTTTGMITACLISSTMDGFQGEQTDFTTQELVVLDVEEDTPIGGYDSMDGPSEDEVYLAGGWFSGMNLLSCLIHAL